MFGHCQVCLGVCSTRQALQRDQDEPRAEAVHEDAAAEESDEALFTVDRIARSVSRRGARSGRSVDLRSATTRSGYQGVIRTSVV